MCQTTVRETEGIYFHAVSKHEDVPLRSVGVFGGNVFSPFFEILWYKLKLTFDFDVPINIIYNQVSIWKGNNLREEAPFPILHPQLSKLGIFQWIQTFHASACARHDPRFANFKSWEPTGFAASAISSPLHPGIYYFQHVRNWITSAAFIPETRKARLIASRRSVRLISALARIRGTKEGIVKGPFQIPMNRWESVRLEMCRVLGWRRVLQSRCRSWRRSMLSRQR